VAKSVPALACGGAGAGGTGAHGSADQPTEPACSGAAALPPDRASARVAVDVSMACALLELKRTLPRSRVFRESDQPAIDPSSPKVSSTT
jgi:hypothetical protein